MLNCLITFLVRLVNFCINDIFLVGGNLQKIWARHIILEVQEHPKVSGAGMTVARE